MDVPDIKFNSKLRMPFSIAQQSQTVLVELSDELAASEEVLRKPYKQKIVDFLNSSQVWFPIAIEKIQREEDPSVSFRLLQIFILSEQDADSLIFGLVFWVNVDVEHQRGMKIDGDTMHILEYGIGDVAFTID